MPGKPAIFFIFHILNSILMKVIFARSFGSYYFELARSQRFPAYSLSLRFRPLFVFQAQFYRLRVEFAVLPF
jgi:hypothetical protein